MTQNTPPPTLPDTMHAIAATAHGPAEVLAPCELPVPTPGPHDLLVRVHATSINPVDLKIRQEGLGFPATFPLVLGYDVSGTVAAIGTSVSHFNVGDAVFASPALHHAGANAEYVLVDHRTAAAKPTSLTHNQAAALPLVTVTAWEALHQHARIEPEQTVLVIGGAGGVGHIAIQIAKAHGCHVIATAGRPESIELATACGADHVIDYNNQSVPEQVAQLTDQQNCSVVFDTVGGAQFNIALQCLAPFGRLVEILPPPPDAAWNELFMRSASLHLEFMGATTILNTNLESVSEILTAATRLIDAGQLKPHVSTTHDFNPDALRDAHNQHATGRTLGKRTIKLLD